MKLKAFPENKTLGCLLCDLYDNKMLLLQTENYLIERTYFLVRLFIEPVSRKL